MKKLTTLVLAAGLVVSSFAGSASAAEFKPFAQFAEEFTYGDAGSTYVRKGGKFVRDGFDAENFNAATRIRFGFDYVASEDLSATMLFQYKNSDWGSQLFDDDPEAKLQMRLAYIDWTIPGTEAKVRMGRQAVVAPSYAFGSAILDSRADGVSVMGNVNENITLGASWLRLESGIGRAIKNNKGQIIGHVGDGFQAVDDTDAVMLTAEFAYDGFKVAPWGMYIVKQNPDSPLNDNFGPLNHHANSYVLGLSAELSMFDPFVFAVDTLYSNTEYSARTYPLPDSYDGFYVGGSAAYKLSNGTLALKGWYATGEDQDDAKTRSFNDKGFVMLKGGFAATTMLFGDNIINDDAFGTLIGADSPFGTWGAVAEYAGFSFMDKLTHTARVAYIEGTNEDTVEANSRSLDFNYLTENDTLIEIDFNSTYEIYKNLSATLELGYIFVDMDHLTAGTSEQDDIFRSALTFVYNF